MATFSLSQNVLKSYFKKTKICPIRGQSDPIWTLLCQNVIFRASCSGSPAQLGVKNAFQTTEYEFNKFLKPMEIICVLKTIKQFRKHIFVYNIA